MRLWHVSATTQKASSENHKVSSKDAEGFFQRALGSYTRKFLRKSLDSVYVSPAFAFRPYAFAFRSSAFVFVSEFRISDGKGFRIVASILKTRTCSSITSQYNPLKSNSYVYILTKRGNMHVHQ